MGGAGLMKKLLVLALVSSLSVVTNGWLVLRFPSPAANDGGLGSTAHKQHQPPIRQKSPTWEEDPTLSSWGPDSLYSRVPGKRSTQLPMSSWGPDSSYSRVPGKREKVQLPWQFDVHMPMIHKRGGLNIWGLDRTIVLPWKVGIDQSGP